jgi:hypothetical protein
VWEASQAAEAEEEAQRLRAERDMKRATYQAAEEKLKQELAVRVEKEKQLLAERERALAEERERKARCTPRVTRGRIPTSLARVQHEPYIIMWLGGWMLPVHLSIYDTLTLRTS